MEKGMPKVSPPSVLLELWQHTVKPMALESVFTKIYLRTMVRWADFGCPLIE